jgi:hypothetical protein
MTLSRPALRWGLPFAALLAVLVITWLLVPRQDAPFIYAFF